MDAFKRSRDPPPKGSDMDQDEDTAFADNYAERDQAKALREQARAGGLRFEAYITGDQADWLLERIERGMFADPSVAENGRASWRDREWPYGGVAGVAVTIKTKKKIK